MALIRWNDPFRDFLKLLKGNGELLTISEEVDPEYELCAFCRHVADDDGPALLFENIKGYPRSKMLINQFGSTRRMNMALGVDSLDPAGVYFGTRSGRLYGSNDGGRSWRQIQDGLPPVVCVKTAFIERKRAAGRQTRTRRTRARAA